jgi:hypothetical protein
MMGPTLAERPEILVLPVHILGCVSRDLRLLQRGHRLFEPRADASLFDIMEDCERRVIIDMLEKCEWNQTEAANRRGEELPLKSNAWNHVQLVFEGRQLALRLNDQVVYERELEPTNRRFFGLFHYADQTEARVRNVRYQGSWPRQLPDQEELFAR